jgi:hypothetical protein
MIHNKKYLFSIALLVSTTVFNLFTEPSQEGIINPISNPSEQLMGAGGMANTPVTILPPPKRRNPFFTSRINKDNRAAEKEARVLSRDVARQDGGWSGGSNNMPQSSRMNQIDRSVSTEEQALSRDAKQQDVRQQQDNGSTDTPLWLPQNSNTSNNNGLMGAGKNSLPPIING